MGGKNKLAIDTSEFWDDAALLQDQRTQLGMCHGCRLCWNFCPAFPTLFDITDGVDGDMEKVTAQDLRPVEDQCYQCKLCYIRCPYTDPHEYDMDVPSLFLRARALRTRKEGLGWRQRLMADTDRTFKMGSVTAPLTNAGNRAAPIRFVMEKVMGVDRKATLPPFSQRTFAGWAKKHGEALNQQVSGDASKVALFHTCYVNYNDTAAGIASMEVLAKNNVRVIDPPQQCCGMPYLDVGATDLVKKKIAANVKSLADLVRQGYDIVSPGPSCSYMIRHEYPQLDPTEDTILVAEHTFDICEYLWKLKEKGSLNTDFKHAIGKAAYHAPCHLRAQFVGNKGVNLMELIPETEVEQIERCSHHDGTWGIMKKSHEVSLEYGKRLFSDMQEAEADVFVSDCPLASTQILHATGRKPIHPMQVLKTAYGI